MVAPAAAYGDASALRAALDGADILFFVSGSEAADRQMLHERTVDAAVAAGVLRIVYVSFLRASPEATFTFARDHWHTEEHIRATGIGFTFLRDSLYQDILPYFVGEDGLIRGPAGEGQFGAVCRDDIADVSAEVLVERGHDDMTYDLTGPEPLTMAEAAQALSRASGREVGYRAETLEEAYRSRAGHGAEQWQVDGWVTSYAAVGTGELDVVTDHVEKIAGHPATGFEEFLGRNPEVLDHLR